MATTTKIETSNQSPALRRIKVTDGKILQPDINIDIDIPLPPPSTSPSQTLPIDQATPDSHVRRDARLIRLTGAHPFNCEPPLTALFEQGMYTCPLRHVGKVVNQRGVKASSRVPSCFMCGITGLYRISQMRECWSGRLVLRGMSALPVLPVLPARHDCTVQYGLTPIRLVETPLIFTFAQIQQNFEQVTAPITLVCAGNRRKEQNIVRKTKGFSWGAAALSTSLFTGPMLGDILAAARPLRRGRYVCMEGADQLVCTPPASCTRSD